MKPKTRKAASERSSAAAPVLLDDADTLHTPKPEWERLRPRTLVDQAAEASIYLQLLGGIWIIQTLPSVMLGAYTRWFNDWALFVGWAAGITFGTAMAAAANLSPTYPLQFAGYTFPGYTALYTVILNLGVTIMLTPLFNAMSPRRASTDETAPLDYYA